MVRVDTIFIPAEGCIGDIKIPTMCVSKCEYLRGLSSSCKVMELYNNFNRYRYWRPDVAINTSLLGLVVMALIVCNYMVLS